MDVIDLREYREEITLYFGGEKNTINAYTLASTLVSIADAIKEANTIINPGFEIEVVVEAFGEGSFKAKVRAFYGSLNNIFSTDQFLLKTIVIGVFVNYLYDVTVAPNADVKVTVSEEYVVVESGNQKVVVPKEVYEKKKEVEKSDKFRESIASVFSSVEKDKNITSFGVMSDFDNKTPDFSIPRNEFASLSSAPLISDKSRDIFEIADLQIVKAVLERSRRKWEFVWRGVRISSPVLHEEFYERFFAHEITIAPGDVLKVRLKIKQQKDSSTGIYTNSSYEVLEVYEHLPRMKQISM